MTITFRENVFVCEDFLSTNPKVNELLKMNQFFRALLEKFSHHLILEKSKNLKILHLVNLV